MAKLFKAAGVESRAELEEVVKGHFRNAQVVEYSRGQLVLTLLLICIFLTSLPPFLLSNTSLSPLRWGILGRSYLTWRPIGTSSWPRSKGLSWFMSLILHQSLIATNGLSLFIKKHISHKAGWLWWGWGTLQRRSCPTSTFSSGGKSLFLQMLPLSRFRDEIKRIKSQKSCSSKAFL